MIVFDEPSAALTEAEIEQLFKIIRDLRKKQYGIVYISHRMDEIHPDHGPRFRHARWPVYRHAQHQECTKEDIINMMVGRTIYETPKSHSNVAPDAPVVLKVEHLNAGRFVQDVSFELRKGEILGMSGLIGAGVRKPAVRFSARTRRIAAIFILKERKWKSTLLRKPSLQG